MARHTTRPPIPVVVNWPGQSHPTPLRGFKKLPKESLWTQARVSRPLEQKLSPLSTVTNIEDLEADDENSPDWASEEARHPLNVLWRKVCATTVFPVIAEPPRRWDGSHQSMQEFLDSIPLSPYDAACDDWWESNTTRSQEDVGECDDGMDWTESLETQPEDTTKPSANDTTNSGDWTTAPLPVNRSDTSGAPCHQSSISTPTAPRTIEIIKFQPTWEVQPMQSGIPDIWPIHTRNTRRRNLEHDRRTPRTSCIIIDGLERQEGLIDHEGCFRARLRLDTDI